MATTAIFAGVAASQAAIAAQEAVRARESACKVVVANFDSKNTTTTAMKEYASCVNTLYPSPASSSEIAAGKILFVVALIGMAIGIWKAKKEWGSDWVVIFVYAGVGFFGFPLALMCVVGLIAGIVWLF